jgi:hypothetical protein
MPLGDRHGHLSRMVTDYDGLILPVLTETLPRAGTGPNRRAAGPCALRGFRSAEGVPLDVTEPTEPTEPTELTETSEAAAFAHKATLAGRLANAESLSEAGRCFGRIAHLRRVLLRLRSLEHRSPGYRNPFQKTDEGCIDTSRYHRSGLPITEVGAR